MISAEKNWHKVTLSIGSSIKNAILILNEVGAKIVLVINKDGVLEGTISDGDIRRGLLKGLDLNSPVEGIVHRNVLSVTPEMDIDRVKRLMIENKIYQIPIINDTNHLVGLHLWDSILTPPLRSNTMVIMAGGLGSRLRPFTNECPKPLLKIGGKPILEHIIERAKLNGFTRFVISINYLGHMIEEYFKKGDRWDVHITYLRETTPLGTAGALALLDSIPDEPFVVTNGDIITDIDFGRLLDFHILQAAIATMAVRIHEWQHPFGVVQTKGFDLIGFEEKPIHRTHINAGVYVLDPSIISFIDPGMTFDMPTLFELAQNKLKRTVVYPMHEPWQDIGRPDDLLAASKSSISYGA